MLVNQGRFRIVLFFRLFVITLFALLLNSCGGGGGGGGGGGSGGGSDSCSQSCSRVVGNVTRVTSNSWSGVSRNFCLNKAVNPTGLGVGGFCSTSYNDERLNLYRLYYQDSDGDGWGNSAVSRIEISQPAGYVDRRKGGDCNDSNASINPSVIEVNNDGIDNDCDGELDEALLWQDSDGDSFGNPNRLYEGTGQPAGYVLNNTDCDDTDSVINPNAIELGDFKDNNCDGQIDEGFFTFYRDSDGDSFGDATDRIAAVAQPPGYVSDRTDCDDMDTTINPNATELGDGFDNNCDGQIDEGFSTFYQDSDSDSYGDINITQLAITQPAGFVSNYADCDDTDSNNNPNATELGDGIDNNCNGYIDESPGSLALNDTGIIQAQITLMDLVPPALEKL